MKRLKSKEELPEGWFRENGVLYIPFYWRTKTIGAGDFLKIVEKFKKWGARVNWSVRYEIYGYFPAPVYHKFLKFVEENHDLERRS